MAQHGYLREYDEGWDRGSARDSDRDDRDRDRQRGEWRGEDRPGGWDEGQRGWSDRDRDWSDRNPDDRFMFGGAHDRSRDEHSRDHGFARRNYSSSPHDHYRSWRDQHMEALDREYEDYCREREQQFHKDFDQWRNNRQQPAAQSASRAPLELGTADELTGGTGVTSPMANATLGTNNSENVGTTRRRR